MSVASSLVFASLDAEAFAAADFVGIVGAASGYAIADVRLLPRGRRRRLGTAAAEVAFSASTAATAYGASGAPAAETAAVLADFKGTMARVVDGWARHARNATTSVLRDAALDRDRSRDAVDASAATGRVVVDAPRRESETGDDAAFLARLVAALALSAAVAFSVAFVCARRRFLVEPAPEAPSTAFKAVAWDWD